LNYDPKTVLGQWVRCKACRAQFVVDRNVSLPTATLGWGPRSKEEKLLLIWILTSLLLVAGIVVAIMLGLT
jgi:hypothetical protein